MPPDFSVVAANDARKIFENLRPTPADSCRRVIEE
jgi:hypothetical protein